MTMIVIMLFISNIQYFQHQHHLDNICELGCPCHAVTAVRRWLLEQHMRIVGVGRGRSTETLKTMMMMRMMTMAMMMMVVMMKMIMMMMMMMMTMMINALGFAKQQCRLPVLKHTDP